MEEPKEPNRELAALNFIRTATALTRLPVHRLTKSGEVEISLKTTDDRGELTLFWEVSHNSKYGQPGPLAYKIETLIINRKIDQAGYPVPLTLKLGSLREICRELGITEGENVEGIKKALYQNALAAITAKLTYKDKNKNKNVFEFGTTRYSVVFTGEELPDGTRADAVYLLFHPLYKSLLDKSETRPLDYNYLRSLRQPLAQRFYELLSPQIFGAVESRRRRAKYLYSQFCKEAPQTRYSQLKRVNMQMKDVHATHLESGYIETVELVAVLDSEGRPDWEMFYTPGPRAREEHREAQRSRGAKPREPRELSATQTEQPEDPAPQRRARKPGQQELLLEDGEDPQDRETMLPEKKAEALSPETRALIEELIANDLNRSAATFYAKANPEECRRQLAYLVYVTEFKSSKGAYLRSAIEEGYGPPKGYTDAKRREEAADKKREEAERRKAAEGAQKAAQAEKEANLDNCMARLEIDAPEAFAAFCAYVDGERRKIETTYARMSPTIRAKMLKAFDTPSKRRELFAAWQAKISDETFRSGKPV